MIISCIRNQTERFLRKRDKNSKLIPGLIWQQMAPRQKGKIISGRHAIDASLYGLILEQHSGDMYVSSFFPASSFHENIRSCLIHNVWFWLITSYLFFSFDVAKYYKMVAQIYCQVKSGARDKTEECKFTYKMAHRNIFLFLDKQKIKSLKISAHMSSLSFPLTFLLQTFCTVKANTSEHNLLFKKEGQSIHSLPRKQEE